MITRYPSLALTKIRQVFVGDFSLQIFFFFANTFSLFDECRVKVKSDTIIWLCFARPVVVVAKELHFGKER